MKNWFVYIIRCSDSSLYTGITTDIQRRFKEHQSGSKGAKYFRKCKPEAIVYSEEGLNRSEASQRESAIKSLSREKKLQLINSSTASSPTD